MSFKNLIDEANYYLGEAEHLIIERNESMAAAEAYADKVIAIMKAGDPKSYTEHYPNRPIGKQSFPTYNTVLQGFYVVGTSPKLYVCDPESIEDRASGSYDTTSNTIKLYFNIDIFKDSQYRDFGGEEKIAKKISDYVNSDSGRIRNTIVHEMTHHQDNIKSNKEVYRKYSKTEDPHAPEKYYNWTHEQNAFFLAFVTDLQGRYKYNYNMAMGRMKSMHWYKAITNPKKQRQMLVRLHQTIEKNGKGPAFGDEYTIKDLNNSIMDNTLDVVKDILKSGIKPDKSSLFMAVDVGNADIIKLLVNAGAEISPSCVGKAISKNNLELVKYLVFHGGTVESAENAHTRAELKGDDAMIKYVKWAWPIEPEMESSPKKQEPKNKESILKQIGKHITNYTKKQKEIQ